MQVASMAASQKTTASGTPDMSATLGSIADGSFMQSSAGQIYQRLGYTVKKVNNFPIPSRTDGRTDENNKIFLV
jgi:hypothetical protein